MKDVREVYPDREHGDYFYDVGDYEPLLDSFGYERLLQCDEDDYQGDSFVLFKNGDQYGYLVFGWGSCSGCDALQACDSYAEIAELQRELHDDIKWMPLPELRAYFYEHDWEGDWSWSSETGREFVAKARELLDAINAYIEAHSAQAQEA